tara:strand:- start:934 stop:1233 length:300 start_codon:yes stop_codon:yes gene_type:complete
MNATNAANVLQVVASQVSVVTPSVQIAVAAVAKPINNSVKLNICGVDLEVRQDPDGHWGNDRVIFYTDPIIYKRQILQYLYNEKFIQDRRTPCTILELS